MTLRRFLHAAFFLFFGFTLTPNLRAADTAAERTKIEALITHLEGLRDTTFVRNGSDYDSKTAAKFLRGKWQSNEKEIKTAADFIAIAATRSSTSGKPYIVRRKGFKDILCAEYLTAQLKKLEAAKNE